MKNERRERAFKSRQFGLLEAAHFHAGFIVRLRSLYWFGKFHMQNTREKVFIYISEEERERLESKESDVHFHGQHSFDFPELWHSIICCCRTPLNVLSENGCLETSTCLGNWYLPVIILYIVATRCHRGLYKLFFAQIQSNEKGSKLKIIWLLLLFEGLFKNFGDAMLKNLYFYILPYFTKKSFFQTIFFVKKRWNYFFEWIKG